MCPGLFDLILDTRQGTGQRSGRVEKENQAWSYVFPSPSSLPISDCRLLVLGSWSISHIPSCILLFSKYTPRYWCMLYCTQHELCRMIVRISQHLPTPEASQQHRLSSLNCSCSESEVATSITVHRHSSYCLSLKGRRRQRRLISHHHLNRKSPWEISFAGKASFQRPHKLAHQLPQSTHPP